MEKNIYLFVDGSVNPKLNFGVGAYLKINDYQSYTPELGNRIKTKVFKDTNSTKLELQTLIWALQNIQIGFDTIKIFTDSNNIITLPERRAKLELKDYRSANHVLLRNHLLYREFFKLLDQLDDYELVKLKGHKPSRDKNDIDKLFALVDRASRKALKNPE